MGLFNKTKKIRTTQEAETLRNVFDEDYALFLKVGESEELSRYNELKGYVNSPVFKENRRKVELLRYKGSEYYQQEREFKALLRNKKLKAYYLIRDSEELQGYQNVKSSLLYEEYTKLKNLINSPGFDKKLRVDEYLRYKEIHNDEKIKAARRFERNKQYRAYQEMCQSDLPEKFEKLNLYIKSDDFKNNRAFLINKKRFETTDDYKLLKEYEEMGQRHNIAKYFTLCEDVSFQNLMRWEQVFSSELKGPNLDREKWITRYYAGERFVNDTYAVGSDVQLFTDENVVMDADGVKLLFKKESISGKYWDNKLGFVEKKFGYTSGMLSTAVSFKESFGRFEAKIKVSRSKVKQTFWLKGEEELPHIQIMEFSYAGLRMGNFYKRDGKGISDMQLVKDVRLISDDYYIFTLEWTKSKLIWRINDTVVKEQTKNIPDTPMYLGLSLGTTQDLSDKNISTSMEIDWVKCYRLKGEM